MAPEAELYSYKVFAQVVSIWPNIASICHFANTKEDGTDEATLIEAFLRAYTDGVCDSSPGITQKCH